MSCFPFRGAVPVLLSLTLFANFSLKAYAETPDFEAATRPPYSPVPEKTMTGKSIEELKEKVQQEWPKIVFEKDGKPVEYLVTLETEAGNIEIELWPDVAPNHARNFIALSKVGFYDGLIFHRCIPGFVIQGGCPVGSGSGGPGYCLKPEFNDRPHVKGVLSMARAQPLDSAGSQFFVCHEAARSLDNQYTAFGKVTKGMEVVDKIATAPTGAMDRPNKPVHIKKAVVTIKGEKK